MATGKLVNMDNSHTFNGSTNQGMVTGCGTCNNGAGVPQATGIVGTQSGGGGYGFQGKGFIGKGPFGPTKYQSGGGSNPLAPTASDYYNQSTAVGYGYKNGGENRAFTGSGYPEITPTTGMNNCQNGGRKTRRKRRRRSKNRQFSKIRSRTRGGSIQKRGGFICKMHKKKSRKLKRKLKKKRTRSKTRTKTRSKTRSRQRGGKRTRNRRRQRGGYRQFQSDIPLSYTMQTPNGSQGGDWTGQLANPPTYKIVNNCQDNYNHYKQK